MPLGTGTSGTSTGLPAGPACPWKWGKGPGVGVWAGCGLYKLSVKGSAKREGWRCVWPGGHAGDDQTPRGSSLVATEGEVGSQEDHEDPPSQAHPQCHLLPGALKKLKDKV